MLRDTSMLQLATALLVMFFASFLSFSLLYLSPGNVAESILREQLGFEPAEDEVITFMERYYLDQPFIVQYYIWLKLLLTGKLVSPQTGESVVGEFLYRFPVTLKLAFMSILLAVAIGITSRRTLSN